MYFRFLIFIFGSFPAIFSYKKSVYTLSTSLGIENTNLDKNILSEYSQNSTFVNHFLAGYNIPYNTSNTALLHTEKLI